MYSGSGAPPLMNQRTWSSFAAANSGASISIFQMVGTPRTTVQRSRSMVRQTWEASNDLCSTIVPPAVKIGIVNAAMPPAW